MKYLFVLWILLVIVLPGCVQYAGIENVRIGMSVDELKQIETPCYCSGQSDKSLTYKCRFKVNRPGAFVQPYILTFIDGKLTDVVIDEKELDRQQIREQFYYRDRYYFHYGYPYYYGYPHHYWYPFYFH